MSGRQYQLYTEAVASFGAALSRIARATEADAERRRDLAQDMHAALWRSFAAFDGRCAVSTWVYRVAHNVAADYVERERRHRTPLVTLDQLHEAPTPPASENPGALARMTALIRTLKMPDRQIVMLYLEDLDAAAIAAIVGMTPGAVTTRISRAKAHLAILHREGGNV